MKRDIEKELIVWKSQKERYPLILRGARQVGKSYTVEQFAKNNFQNTIVINFEFQPQLKECFSSLDPAETINKIQLFFGIQVKAEDTLIFLDEIQECPQAIMSLRYFKEKMPALSIIGAGSLMEFALKSSDLKMPVGRVQFLYLEPLSFSEFLDASGNNQLRQHLSQIRLGDETDDLIHQRLIELLRLYFILGGMPAILKEYFMENNLLASQHLQNSLLQTFRNDFGKYSKISQQKYLLKVFDSTPRLIGQRIKYSNIAPEMKSRDLKNALELLVLAGIVKPIFATSASGLPLGAQINEQKFKLNFLDIGLMQNVCGLQNQISLEKNFMQINSGAVVEQFIGQELRANSDKYMPSSLYFWARDKRGSSAEVDYIINIGSEILPIEVKAGKTGTLKSLSIFLKEKKARFGIRISQEKLSYYGQILSVPLYMAEQIPRLVHGVLSKG